MIKINMSHALDDNLQIAIYFFAANGKVMGCAL